RGRPPQDFVAVRALRAVRSSKEIVDGRQHGTRGHSRAPGHLQDRKPGSPALRRPADGRLHRRRRQAGLAVMSARDRVVESPTGNRRALSSALILSGLLALAGLACQPAVGKERRSGSLPSADPTLALLRATVINA